MRFVLECACVCSRVTVVLGRAALLMDCMYKSCIEGLHYWAVLMDLLCKSLEYHAHGAGNNQYEVSVKNVDLLDMLEVGNWFMSNATPRERAQSSKWNPIHG